MPLDNDPAGSVFGRRRVLLCLKCRRNVDCTAEDWLLWTMSSWPACCGEEMALFSESPRPGPDDTTMDTPRPPPSAS